MTWIFPEVLKSSESVVSNTTTTHWPKALETEGSGKLKKKKKYTHIPKSCQD